MVEPSIMPQEQLQLTLEQMCNNVSERKDIPHIENYLIANNFKKHLTLFLKDKKILSPNYGLAPSNGNSLLFEFNSSSEYEDFIREHDALQENLYGVEKTMSGGLIGLLIGTFAVVGSCKTNLPESFFMFGIPVGWLVGTFFGYLVERHTTKKMNVFYRNYKKYIQAESPNPYDFKVISSALK